MRTTEDSTTSFTDSPTTSSSKAPSGYDKIKAEGGPFDSLIQSASDTYGVPYDLLHKQLFLESSFNPKAVSPTGPRGLAQMTKATGKAYGLIHEEDFFDPAKSIDAAARHMRDNIKIAGGDELKALLVYNQGYGRNGRSQIEAYDRGDFSKVSPEGLHYMEQLRDVTTNGKSAELDSFVKPIGGFEAPAGIEALSKVSLDAPGEDQASFQITGEERPGQAKPFAQLLQETIGKNTDEDRGFFEGAGNNASVQLQTSVLGMMVRAAQQDTDSDFSGTYARLRDLFNDSLPDSISYLIDPLQLLDSNNVQGWDEEHLDQLRKSGLDPQYYDFVLGKRREDFGANLKIAMETQQLEKTIAQDRFGAQMLGAGGAMLGDPLTWVNPAIGGGASLGTRLARGAAVGAGLGAASEYTAANASGREMHIGAAIAGGAAFGGLLNGLFGSRLGSQVPDRAAAHSELQALIRSPGVASPEASIRSSTSRLNKREQARLDGLEDDPTAMPFRADAEEVRESASGSYLDMPGDPETVRTLDGSIHSGGSPLNPKTIEGFRSLDVDNLPTTEAPQGDNRAFSGMQLGGLTEIGLRLGSSRNDEIRLLAYDLFRSPTGYKDGSNGKYGATASDIAERLRSQDNVVHNRIADGFDEALKDPFWRAQSLSQGAQRETISRRVVEALESSTPRKLTPPEQKLLEQLRKHMNRKWDYISNPAQFGNLKARALLEDTRHFSSYFPQRYSSAAKQLHLQRFGGQEELREAIAHSWMASYLSRPHVKQRVDAMIQEQHLKAAKGSDEPSKALTDEELYQRVQKYANDKAMGISHSDNFTASSHVEEHVKDMADIGNNNYLEARNLFDSDMRISTPDGGSFAVNDLREFDLLRVVPQYDRRVNGDIALMGGTGKSTKELTDLVAGLQQVGNKGRDKTDAEALEGALKMFTGRARRAPDDAFGMLARSLNDLGFFSKNAYMGYQNFTEAASLVTKGHQRMLLKGVPMLKELSTMGAKLKPEDVKTLQGLMFGKELDDLIRPTRRDLVDQLRERHSEVVAQTMGTIRFGTQELAARSPFTWLLRESGNYLMDAGRQGVLVDLIDHTLNGKATNLFSPERLRSASIAPEQFAGIQDLIRGHFKMDKKSGKWRIENPQALASDVRSMDLYRLGDRVADETMLRPHKMSSAPSKQYGPGLAMALQFKMFVLRSVNGRGFRGWMEATKNRQAVDQVMQAVVSVGLATAFYYASAHLKAQALPERERKRYLDRALSPGMLAYAGLSRSSHIGAPLGTANFIAAPLGYDQAAMVRTSILPRGDRAERPDRAIRYSPLQSDQVGDILAGVGEQVPAANMVGYMYQAGHSGYHLLEDERGADRRGYRTGLWNALKQFVPNDPVLQSGMRALAEDQGVDLAR